jgi:aspartate-semialdehyde dehydrogenase
MNRKPNIAIVGATGLVGSTFLKVLEERKFPFENLYLMASAKSAGSTVHYQGKDYIVEELTENSFDKPIDIALFSAGGTASEKFAPIAASKGVVVVDNSSAWRMDPTVPLVVPEVNPQDVKWNKGSLLIQTVLRSRLWFRLNRCTTNIRSRGSCIRPIRLFQAVGLRASTI